MLIALLQMWGSAFNATRNTGAHALTCLTFRLSGVLFGIDAGFIKDIVRCGMIAKPGDKPGFLYGCYRHEGRMLPIIDLAKRYSGCATHIGGRACIVIVELLRGGKRQEIGILTEDVCGLVGMGQKDLKPIPTSLERMLGDNIIEGFISGKSDLLVVLGIQRLLDDDEFGVLVQYAGKLS